MGDAMPGSVRINWNRIAAVVAAIAALFLFTRSAPFPAETFWELTLARDFDVAYGMYFPPEFVALKIVESAASLLGLKAFYHILYFLICSCLCLLIFKAKEALPGLVALASFALSMQVLLPLRHLFMLLFVVIMMILFDEKALKKHIGLILLPIIAAATGLGLPSWLLVVLVACHSLGQKKFDPLMLLCAIGGLLMFPEGMAASINYDSVLKYSFVHENDIKLIFLLGHIFLVINLFSISNLKTQERPNCLFYALTLILSYWKPEFLPVFLIVGLVLIIKSVRSLPQLGLNYQLGGIILLTVIIHLFLFFNPMGIKLNPAVHRQIGKNLAPVLDGYIMSHIIQNTEIGELAWKRIIEIKLEDLEKYKQIKEWCLHRNKYGRFTLEPAYITAP